MNPSLWLLLFRGGNSAAAVIPTVYYEWEDDGLSTVVLSDSGPLLVMDQDLGNLTVVTAFPDDALRLGDR